MILNLYLFKTDKKNFNLLKIKKKSRFYKKL